MCREADRRRESSGKTDWDTIHERLNILEKELSQSISPDRSVKEKILKERAQLLAKPVSDESVSAGFIDLLFFQLSGEEYGIESRYVLEVHPLEELTALPGLPAFILGIVNLRGRIVSVVDLGKLFDLPRRGLTDQDRVIVVSDGRMEIGFLANDIAGMTAIHEESIQEPLATLTGIRRELLKGVTGERVVILDAARLLTDERLRVGSRGE